jgi:cytochrome b6-f complex subunit 5
LSFILIRSYTRDSIKKKDTNLMVEPLLSGIVLGLIPVTISGLFVTAYLQYRRGDQLNF